KVSLATKNPTEGSLGPTWEGPYEITKVCRLGTYQLLDPKGKTLPHPWNVDDLKYYYNSSEPWNDSTASAWAAATSSAFFCSASARTAAIFSTSDRFSSSTSLANVAFCNSRAFFSRMASYASAILSLAISLRLFNLWISLSALAMNVFWAQFA
ncbi:unnamed protein product, partial [Prunus brigantina]